MTHSSVIALCCSPDCSIAHSRNGPNVNTPWRRYTSGSNRKLGATRMSRRRASAGRSTTTLAVMSGPQELQHLQVVKPQLTSILASAESAVSPVGGLAAFLLLLTGYGIWRFTTYGRLQYITAAMLGRWVPKGGARVIQIGGGSRDLYYYPKDTVLVTAISPKLKKGMMGQAAIQAGVPCDVRQETPKHLSFQGNSSVEAVVSLYSLHTVPDLPRFLAEIERVLKPGCPFIFLQAVKGSGLSSAAQLLLGGSGSALDTSALDKLKSMNGFESVEWDVALAGQNPHAIGVAVKAGGDSSDREIEFERRATKNNRNRKQSVKSGFGKS